MISHLQMITVYVSDLERAVAFYTDTLGLAKTAEYDDGAGTRLAWVVPQPALPVALSTEIGLQEVPAVDPRIGSVSGVVFTAEDIEATYHELKRRGVRFTMELVRHGYGKGEGDQEANFADPDGNVFILHT